MFLKGMLKWGFWTGFYGILKFAFLFTQIIFIYIELEIRKYFCLGI